MNAYTIELVKATTVLVRSLTGLVDLAVTELQKEIDRSSSR